MARALRLTLPPMSREGMVPFSGIDRRRRGPEADPASLWDAVNVDLTVGGEIAVRDGLFEFAHLPPGTHGLYALGSQLRVAVPSGSNLQWSVPPPIVADVFGDRTTGPTPLTRYVRVSAVSSWRATSDLGPVPYLVLEDETGQFVHHYLDRRPSPPTEFMDTRVQLGFLPGPDILRLAGKMWATDPSNGRVRFSSTQFGPAVWDEAQAPRDAGSLAPFEHAQASTEIRGIAQRNGKLLIVFDTAMQVWTVDPDPLNHVIASVLNGPGTTLFGSLVPVVNDIIYASNGGFRSLEINAVTPELRENDVGDPIRDLTRGIDSFDPSRVRALWSPSRSQYLCAVNDDEGEGGGCTVYARTISPFAQGWTRWRLPIAVDYWTELGGVLYLRRGDMVYFLKPGVAFDIHPDGIHRPFEGDADFQFMDGGRTGVQKNWHTATASLTGEMDLWVRPDVRDRAILELAARKVTAGDSAFNLPIQAFAPAIALRAVLRPPTTLHRIEVRGSLSSGT